jgi:tRNA(Ile)-lysidine synthase
VLPLVERRFPAYRSTVARVARHLAEADGLLADLAHADGVGALEEGTLAVAALARLSPARARNLMRYFLGLHGETMPGAQRLDECLRQALHARGDAQVLVDLGRSVLRRFEGRLYVVPKLPRLSNGYARRWRGERVLPLPDIGGVLALTPSRGRGVSLARLRGRPVAIRLRRGGERLQPDRGRPRRTLKNLLQEARLPPWVRERLPLLFCGDDLVWAPGAGVDCAYQAAPHERAVNPGWRPAVNLFISKPYHGILHG